MTKYKLIEKSGGQWTIKDIDSNEEIVIDYNYLAYYKLWTIKRILFDIAWHSEELISYIKFLISLYGAYHTNPNNISRERIEYAFTFTSPWHTT